MYHQSYHTVPSAVYGAGDENASVVMSKGYAVGSRHGSPTPIPQAALGRQALPPMSPLPSNRRSFSRMSSQRGLEDTPLGSPMPMFPRRGRSVTFVGEDERCGADGGVCSDADLQREERPFYHTSTTDSAMKSSRSRGSTGAAMDDDVSAAQRQVASIMVKHPSDDTSRIARTLPTPRKALMTPTRRSASRQRLECRRQQAVMNHSFYDDSFVEEFVTTAKDELEKKFEEEARQAAAEKERARAEAAAAEERRQHELRQHQQNEAARQRASQQHQSSGDSKETLSLSTISHHNNSGEDSRAMLARLLKEFSALEGSKPYITDMTPRKSAHNPPVLPSEAEEAEMQTHRHVGAGRVGGGGRQQSVLLPEQYESDGNVDYDDAYDEENHAKAPRGHTAATGGRTQRKEARIESLIREAMRDYRRTKKSSVMLIDLKNLAESDSEAPSPEDTKRGRSKTKQPDVLKEAAGAAKPANQRAKRNQSMLDVQPPPIVVRKRARSEKKVAPPLRQDSRPQFDDDSDYQDGCDSDSAESAAERPILLSRGSKKLPVKANSRQASRGRRVEAEVDAILGLDNRNAAPVMLPRAAPPARPQARGARGKGKSGTQAQTEMAAPPTVHPFVSPYVEPTLTRTAAASARAAPAQRKVDPNDPFAHFFDLQFDSPAKFDEAPEGTKATRRTNGGLMLAGSCRTRRK